MSFPAATLSPLSNPPTTSKNILQQRKPDAAISLLEICRHNKEFIQIHTLLIKTSLVHQKHAFGRLLLSFSSSNEPNSLHYTKKLLSTTNIKNTFIYNTIMRAFLNHNNPKEAFLVYYKMLCDETIYHYPDDFTFTFVFAACSKLLGVFEGKQAHAHFVKYPIKFGTHSWNSLLDFYVKSEEMGFTIQKIFDEIENPDIVSWNCLLDGCIKSGQLDNARKVFDKMPVKDTVSWTIMLVGYANAELLTESRNVFEGMPVKNVVSWSAMIGAYVKAGCCKEALVLFEEMQDARVKSDKITLTSVLSACGSLGAIDQGCWIHAYIDKHGIEVDAHLTAALVDMYSKCGRVDVALDLFRKSQDKKVFVWNAILGGLAMAARGEEAVELFSELVKGKTKPNEITYICVLSACSHSGLVDDGMRIFKSMVQEFRVVPTVEHYGCVVDLLSRAGLLNEVREVIRTMPMEAETSIWRTLLGACRIHGNIELGIEVGKLLIELEPLNDANYVLLSNIYAVDNRWEDVANLRRIMKERGLNKRPGCSSIELNGAVHEFIVGDISHPQIHDIYEFLACMANHSKIDKLDDLQQSPKFIDCSYDAML